MGKYSIVPAEFIEKRIFLIRGQKVMLDVHLAELYSVPTKSLNLAVKRNRRRFPEDFMFQLSDREFSSVKARLRFQIETSNIGRGGRRYVPYVFTEQGVAMLSGVLNSARAIRANIAIMRAFVKLREILSTHKELAQRLSELERKAQKHDAEIHAIFDAIRHLMAIPEKPKRQLGFRVSESRVLYRVKRSRSHARN